VGFRGVHTAGRRRGGGYVSARHERRRLNESFSPDNGADGDAATENPGAPSRHDGILVLSRTDEGGEGWGCQNATTARNNVVITAGVCGNYIDAGVVESIVQNVAAKVTTQT
jgi:hypothetical protein